jgi:hypothetical protein
VPEVLVTVPELTVTPTEYVNRSAAHAAGVVTVIVGKALTVITTLFDLLQPVAVIVSVTVYVVVTAGLTVGFAAVDVYPAGTDVQLYVLPATAAAPIGILDPEQIEPEVPAAAAGNGLTVIVIAVLLLLLQLVVIFLASA